MSESQPTTYRMLIGGERVAAESDRLLDSIDPATGAVWARIPEASAADVDRAVAAARAAFTDPAWAGLTGWQAHARPFDFEPDQDYAEGAARFLTGTPNVPALYAATAGYDVIEEVGIDRIRERSVEQTTLLIELLEEAGFPVGSPSDSARRGGTVVVRPPDFERIDAELAARGILCDHRPDVGLRLGPHFFNTDDELRHTVEQIAELAGQRTSLRP